MTRTIADLRNEDSKWLDQIAAEQGKSRGEVLRRVIRRYRRQIESRT